MSRRTRIVLVGFVLALVLGGTAFAQQKRIDDYHRALQGKMTTMVGQGQSAKVDMNDSKDGKGLDPEIRLTMGIREFESFAPIAALEAAALPHKFDVVNIYVRHEATDRVGRIAFKDAEPLAAMYNAGEREQAIERMKTAIIWH
ncbi:MAG TPA: hypothetical protein VJH87_10650 [Vicinamibacteria bacterium]|nr:hypothetical protein [Vicinamibacteria bacterium]